MDTLTLINRVGSAPKEDRSQDQKNRYDVVVYDNDVNTYEEVMAVSIQALGISWQDAYQIAWEIDHYGKAIVAQKVSYGDAQRIHDVFRQIGIGVEIVVSV